jgi:hypothetical protein
VLVVEPPALLVQQHEPVGTHRKHAFLAIGFTEAFLAAEMLVEDVPLQLFDELLLVRGLVEPVVVRLR